MMQNIKKDKRKQSQNKVFYVCVEKHLFVKKI